MSGLLPALGALVGVNTISPPLFPKTLIFLLVLSVKIALAEALLKRLTIAGYATGTTGTRGKKPILRIAGSIVRTFLQMNWLQRSLGDDEGPCGGCGVTAPQLDVCV